MKEVGAIFHAAGKIVSYNPVQIARIDFMEVSAIRIGK